MSKNFVDLFLNRKLQFERVIQKLQVVSAKGGNVKAKLNVEEEHVNQLGQLHTGLIAMLTDKMTALALLNKIQKIVPLVSTDLHVRVLKPSSLGEMVTLNAVVIRYEDNVAFGEAIFKDPSSEIVARGTHTIYVMSWKNLTNVHFK